MRSDCRPNAEDVVEVGLDVGRDARNEELVVTIGREASQLFRAKKGGVQPDIEGDQAGVDGGYSLPAGDEFEVLGEVGGVCRVRNGGFESIIPCFGGVGRVRRRRRIVVARQRREGGGQSRIDR